jgi:hypothetical protein
MIDPAVRTFRNARREALIVLSVWFAALVWTVGYCYVNGYSHDPDGWLVRNGLAEAQPAAITQMSFGMPKWICWGIVSPALCCALFTLAFGLFVMRDDPLGVENEEGQS